MAKQRGRETARDMLLSLGVVVLIILAVYLLNPPDSPSPVRPADAGDRPAAVASAVRSASWPVLDPTDDLPDDWTLTVARTTVPDVAGEGPTTLLLGYVTADEEYVGVTQVDSSAEQEVRDATSEAEVQRSETVGGAEWDVHAPAGEQGDRVLSWTDDGRTVVVRGTGTPEQLRTAAAAVAQATPAEEAVAPTP